MEKKKWFSWGWLIFWSALSGGELGIIYLIIKYAQKKKL